MGMKFVLKETLESLKIPGNQLAVEAKVRNNTIYDMLDDRTKRIERKTLEDILRALNKIAKKQGVKRKFNIEDVMIWVDED